MDLLSIDSLTDAQIGTILERADHWFDWNRGHRASGHMTIPIGRRVARERRPGRLLEGRIVFNLFYENSTRTLMSFATAAHRLGASVVTMPVEQSSVKKGETLEDTARTLNAMRPDTLVLRHPDNAAPPIVAEIMEAPVINAGNGTDEHPTQALLDAAALKRRLGRVDGLRIAICGDIKHSRVARSGAKLLARLGADVRLAGPSKLMPDDLAPLTVDDAIADADVVMMLRVQRERLDGELGDGPGEYLGDYGLTADRLARAAPGAVVMHPGPMNRGIEIESAIADDKERSMIALQVEMGVAVRMACFELLLA